MNFKKRLLYKPPFISFHLYLPVFLWCIGFLFGVVIGRFAEPAVVYRMLCALQMPLSIDGLLASYFLPLLLWIVMTQAKHATLLGICCFLDAFILAYLMRCLVFCIPYCLMLLLLVPSLCNSISLLWLSVRIRIETNTFSYWLPITLISVIAALDYFVLSPFVSSVTM